MSYRRKTGTELETGRSQRQPSMAQARWEEEVLKPALERSPERQEVFTTLSGVPVERLYTPSDLADFDYSHDLGDPGEYPFTRGIHRTMYRGRVWTMRQFSGFGSPEDTNQRLHYLLKQGQTGLSIAFDLPTLMGYDSDHALAEGEVGKCGVTVSSLADMETLLAGLPLEQVTTSMTINSPAAIIWAMYLAVAEKSGAELKKISGTTQNDILKEYIAQKEYIFPPKPSMRLVVDSIVYGVREVLRCRSCLTNVVAANGDGIPAGDFPGAIHNRVHHEAHRRLGRKDVFLLGDVLLENVILCCS